VDILVAEVGTETGEDEMYHVNYDGTIVDEERYAVLGGDADAISARLASSWSAGLSLGDALRVSIAALARPDRILAPGDLVAGLHEAGAGAHRVRAVMAPTELAEDALGPQPGGEHPRIELVEGREQPNHLDRGHEKPG